MLFPCSSMESSLGCWTNLPWCESSSVHWVCASTLGVPPPPPPSFSSSALGVPSAVSHFFLLPCPSRLVCSFCYNLPVTFSLKCWAALVSAPVICQSSLVSQQSCQFVLSWCQNKCCAINMLIFMPFISGLMLMLCKTSGISLVHQDVLKMKMSRSIILSADFPGLMSM